MNGPSEARCPEPQDDDDDDVDVVGVADVDECGRQWMLQFQTGDESAFERIVTRYRRPVEHFILGYVGDRDRAEDLTQEVFVRVFRARRRYVPSARLKTWLYTIAARLALNEIRGARRRRRVVSEGPPVDEENVDAAWERTADHRELSPGAALEQRELEDVVDELIERLPANQKAALVLSRVEDLSYREIGKVLGVSVMSVKSLLMRARESLRARLEPYLSSGALEKRAMKPRRET